MAAATSTTNTAVPTAFIAMTSIFNPPPSCSSSWTYEPSDFNANPSGLFIQNAVGGDTFNTACWPTSFTHNGRAEVLGTVQVYSPGACPIGYTSAILQPGDTTTVTCCQSGFSYHFSSATSGERAGGGLAGCISTFSSDESTTVLARPLGTLTPNTLIVTSTLDGASLGQVTMWGQPITVAFQQKDLSLFSTSSSSSSGSATAAASSGSSGLASASSSGSALASSAASSDDSSSGLSTGAKVGIGIGAALGVLALLGIAIFALRRRRKQQNTHVAAHEAEPRYSPQEMDGEGVRAEMSHTTNPTAKVDPTRVHELQGSEGRYA